ncbi:alpha/beta fold hydrolase [Nocardiopsis coralliicola]
MDRTPNRRRRLLRISAVVAACALAAAAAAAVSGPSSPVGHWDSAEGRDRYMAAYDKAFEALPEPAETRDVRTDYGVVRAYRFTGADAGPAGETPLVLLPGRASGTPVWASNLPSLLELGDVYAVDLLGEPGRSVQERPIENDDDQARWLAEALAGLDEESFHVVGMSIGGWTAVNLAVREPDRVATLSLIDPAQVFGDIPLETAVRSIPAAVPWTPKSWRDSFNSYTAGGHPVEDVPEAHMIEAGMQHYALRLPQPARPGDAALEGLPMPVLAVIAEESVMHDGPAAARTAERTLRDGTVRLYPGASHAVNGEHPDEIAADLAEFLTAHG